MARQNVIMYIVIVVILVGGGIIFSRRSPDNGSVGAPVPTSSASLSGTPDISPISQNIMITGTGVCLPHRNTSGPQTMECAYGLRTDDGSHYAISMDADSAPDFQTGQQITILGTFVPVEALSTDHWRKYDIKGIIQVESSSQQ